MKKQKSILLVGLLLLLLFVAVSLLTFYRSKGLIERGYLASEGSAAENFAVLTAANISLTDAQVATLKQYSYDELLASEENLALEKMMDNASFATKVDYAYIMIHLKDDEVKYEVTEENRDRFDAPAGTKLDIMWLLDVNVGEYDAQSEGSDELTRYSYYIEEDAVIFGEAPTYIFNASEWGDHICGYAPIYTVEGNYIGVIGVELETVDYDAYCGQAVRAMGVVLVVSLLTLSLLFLYIYQRYRRVQFDKIYTDALTQIYNRSYYNNLFIRRMDARHSDRLFALMIADVDWFKRVNDTFGHEIGDEVLIETGALLVDIFGKEHVVRFGGEEFVIGMWVNDEGELTEKLDLLFARIAEHRFSTQKISLSISLGCSVYEAQELHGWLLSGMLRAADCKLYEAKGSGRCRYLIERYDESKEYKKDDGKPQPPTA